MKRRHWIMLSAALVFTTAFFVAPHHARPQAVPGAANTSIIAPASQPATQPTLGRGRRGRRGFVPTPDMEQDPATGQWYTPMKHSDYAFGADVSSTQQLEERGKIFKDAGQPKPLLHILQDHGYNWVRLRVCVPTATLPQTTAYTVACAKAAKKLGYMWILDFHYSNGWADPTNEPTPRDWQNKSHAELTKLLFEYTRDTMLEFAKNDCVPDVVQIGNEVSNGFLWPNAFLPDKWDDFADLIAAGEKGVEAGHGAAPMPKIAIHVDHGGNIPKTRAFFDHFNTYKIPYDIIAFSFYPWSHGTLMDLRDNLAFTAKTYQKDILVVETGYYHAPSQYFKQTPGPFPETPEGQAQWLDAVNKIVMEVPDSRGRGVFWWEPAADAGLTARGYFDPDGNSQPILNVFQPYTRPVHRVDNQ